MYRTAEDVAEQPREANRLGVDLAMLTFPHYLEDLHRFVREVQPLLHL